MSNIIQFPGRDDPAKKLFWQCGCGCISFELRGDGVILCAKCRQGVSADIGDWRAKLPETPADPKPLDEGVTTVTDLNNSGAALRHVFEKISEGTTSQLIVLQHSGEVSAWGEYLETPEQSEWFDSRIAKAKELFTRPEALT